jgi:hypothetical protein
MMAKKRQASGGQAKEKVGQDALWIERWCRLCDSISCSPDMPLEDVLEKIRTIHRLAHAPHAGRVGRSGS